MKEQNKLFPKEDYMTSKNKWVNFLLFFKPQHIYIDEHENRVLTYKILKGNFYIISFKDLMLTDLMRLYRKD